ncbi:hypothetical protein [Allorhizocola rhizosphaerae]|uniref:hypothetical protein n=1 Tax=Allorhizocola rhizosphaerae TaxID=1872709 RepID=UPI000E3E3A2D|nr:hypothetical protein [Allorhizocola rhizosphaerae]
MAIDYTTVPIPQQYQLITPIEPLAGALTTASANWRTAAEQLSAAAASLQGQAQDARGYWQDSAGGTFADGAQRSAGEVGLWSSNITGSRVPQLLQELAALIPQTVRTVREAHQQYLRLVAMHTNGISVIDQILALQKKSGAAMNQLAELFERVGRSLNQVASGSPQWSGPRGGSGGGAAGGGGGQTAMASTGAGGGPSAASAASGPQASAGAGMGGASQPDLAGDPTLQGGGALPPSPHLPLPQPAQPIPAGPPVGGLPFIPPVGVAGGGGRHGGSVNLGPKPIARAAVPILADAIQKTNGSPPAAASAPLTARPGGTPTTGLVPPMAPMMGGMGAGGSAGVPGPGTAQRPVPGRGAKPTSTPGLPPALQGKAARTERPARPARRVRETDNTVPLLDDELWQISQAPTAIRAERPVP